MLNIDSSSGDGDEDHIDACICDIEISESDITPDSELPAAQGGVEATAEQDDTSDEIDGCDVEFTKADATPDDELPVAIGGVA